MFKLIPPPPVRMESCCHHQGTSSHADGGNALQVGSPYRARKRVSFYDPESSDNEYSFNGVTPRPALRTAKPRKLFKTSTQRMKLGGNLYTPEEEEALSRIQQHLFNKFEVFFYIVRHNATIK